MFMRNSKVHYKHNDVIIVMTLTAIATTALLMTIDNEFDDTLTMTITFKIAMILMKTVIMTSTMTRTLKIILIVT